MQSAAAYDQRPLVPDDMPPSKAIMRASWAAVAAESRGQNAADMCARLFPRDPLSLSLLQRSAVAGASTAVPSWAGSLAGRVTGDFLAALVPESAGAQLMALGTSVSLVNKGSSMAIPTAAPAATSPWVAESSPMPVQRTTFTAPVLTPKKMGVLTVFSWELARFAGAQPILELLLRQQGAASLDSGMFSSAAGSAAAHPGLLAGLSAIPAGANMAADLAALAEAVSPLGSPIFVTSPGRAAACRIRQPAEATATVLGSLGVPSTRIICIAPEALIHGTAGLPDIEAAKDSTLHMEDTTPLDIGTAGAPAAVAAPTVSMFQTGQISLRLLLEVGWVAQRANAVAFVDNPVW